MVASRPQPARGGGITTVHIWLIVFVALWLVSMVLAVLLFTGREELLASAESAREEAQKYMRKNEAGRYGPFLSRADEGQSLATVLDNERIAALQLIGVDETTNAAAAAKLVSEMIPSLSEGSPKGAELPDLEGADLISIVKKLAAAWQAQAQAVADASKRLNDAMRELRGATDRRVAEETGFKQALGEVGSTLQRVQAETDKSLDEKNDQIKEFGRQLVKARDELEKPLARQLEDLKQAENKIEQLRKKLQLAHDQLTQFRPKVASLDLASQADGEIIRAETGEEMTFINLGQENHLTLGLRFQVFSASSEVDQSGRGKATIEVVRINPTTSACRIVESNPANPILAGDHVVNVVYARDRKYQFVVEGEFDIDRDGRSDGQDTDRIKAWIRAWGGQVVDLPPRIAKSVGDLGLETVDFVVLGGPPPSPPSAKKGERISPEERVRNDTMQRVLDRFFAIKGEAKDLSLAVLTQSQFLHFIGYGTENGPRSKKAGGSRTAMNHSQRR